MNKLTASNVRLTELLSREHRLIERGIVVLARLCAHLRRGGELPGDEARELLRFIHGYADSHHHAKEEDLLFPWMRSLSPQLEAGPLAVMLTDHEHGRGFVAAMAAALDTGATDAFVANGEAYASLIARHIWKEDHILYPMADALGGGTAGLYDPVPNEERAAEEVEREFRAVIERLERAADAWPPEDVEWPQGCHQ